MAKSKNEKVLAVATGLGSVFLHVNERNYSCVKELNLRKITYEKFMFLCKTKPILRLRSGQVCAVSSLMTSKYEESAGFERVKTNPKQTQFKANLTQFKANSKPNKANLPPVKDCGLIMVGIV